MITYRPIQTTDAAILAQLHTASWRSAYRGILSEQYLTHDIEADRLKVWSKRMANPVPNQYGVIALEDNTPVGFVFVYGNDHPQWGSLVDNLHILPDYKGKGLGSSLLGHAAAWAQNHYPAAGLYLWVYEANESAVGFYEHVGGQRVETDVKSNPGGGEANCFCYAWPDVATLIMR